MNLTPTHWQRFEGLAVLIACLLLYYYQDVSWLLFAVLFLVPDVSMIGYVRGAAVGALAYNLGHTYVLSIALGCVGLLLQHPTLIALSLIWTGHIGFDRFLGFGLKLSTGFNDTDLGRIGRASNRKQLA